MLDKAAIQICDIDYVATAAHELLPSETVKIRGVHEEYEIQVRERIPVGHKIALRDIAAQEEVLKYGEIIGLATCPIPAGCWVHIHNCWGIKARRYADSGEKGGEQSE